MSITAWALFATLKTFGGLRVSEEEELAGLDVLEHGAPGYGEGFGSFVPAPSPSMSPSATDVLGASVMHRAETSTV